MDVKARVMTKDEFLWEYRGKHPNATLAQAQDEYGKYEEEQGKQTRL